MAFLRPTLCLVLLFAAVLRAAIPVLSAGALPLTFDSLPPTNEWTTLHISINSPNVSNVFGLNQLVQSFGARDITNQLTTSLVYPSGGSGAGAAVWSSPARLLETRPTGNCKALLLMARLENRTGVTLSALHLSYLMGMPVTNYVGGELSGYWVYFSTSGLANTWQLIPDLSGFEEVNARVEALVEVGTWPAGSEMFLLWADDNADGITDRPYTIDNLAIEPLRLKIAPVDGAMVQLSWPMAAADFEPWSATVLHGNGWQRVNAPRAATNGFFSMVLPTDGRRFFRLQKSAP